MRWICRLLSRTSCLRVRGRAQFLRLAVRDKAESSRVPEVPRAGRRRLRQSCALVRSSHVRHGPQRVRSRRQAAHATQAPIHAGSSPSRHACSQQTRRRRRKRSHLGDDKSHRSHHGLFVNIQPGTTLMQDLRILHQSAAGEGSSIQRILVRVLHGPVDRLATISWAPRSHGPTQDQANCTRELPTSVPTAPQQGGRSQGSAPPVGNSGEAG